MDYGCSKELPPNDPRQEEWERQRKERGFDDTETWNLDCAITLFITPRLERFKELNCCHPSEMTAEQWDEILQKMINGFKTYSSSIDETEEFTEAWELFTKYFRGLWW